METSLGQLNDRWDQIVWGMDPYKGTDVPLLKIAEEDFEALEVHSGTERRSLVTSSFCGGVASRAQRWSLGGLFGAR